MYGSALKTTIQKAYGLHQITDAIQHYLGNQTAGKIIIKPSLTAAGEKPTQEVNLNMLVAKL